MATEPELTSLSITKNYYTAKDKPYLMTCGFKTASNSEIKLELSGDIAIKVFEICRDILVQEVQRVSNEAMDYFLKAMTSDKTLLEGKVETPPNSEEIPY